jgi:hypothetical protein
MDYLNIVFVLCLIIVAVGSYILAARTAPRPPTPSPQGPRGSLRCKIGPRGGVSVYGLQRYPVTLYANQWQRLGDFMPDIMRFINDNRGKSESK